MNRLGFKLVAGFVATWFALPAFAQAILGHELEMEAAPIREGREAGHSTRYERSDL